MIIEQIRSDLRKTISPIVPADYPLFRQYFQEDRRQACYGNGWAYIIQACRAFGLGLKFTSNHTLVAIGKHCDHFVLVRPLGSLDESIILLLDELQRISQRPVFIKKLFPDQVDTLHQLGCFAEAASYDPLYVRAYPKNYVWDEAAYADDDTYPELIIHLETTLKNNLRYPVESEKYSRLYQNPENEDTQKHIKRRRQEFRRRLRQFYREGVNTQIEDYLPQRHKDLVEQFLYDYFGQNNSQNVEAYKNILSDECFVDREKFYAWVGFIDGVKRPVGFFFAERTDPESVACYAGIAQRCYQGYPECFDIQILQRLQNAGLSYLNLGGSEKLGLHRFKQRLTPIVERYMPMLVYGVS